MGGIGLNLTEMGQGSEEEELLQPEVGLHYTGRITMPVAWAQRTILPGVSPDEGIARDLVPSVSEMRGHSSKAPRG